MAKGFRFIHCGDLHLGSPFQHITATDDRWQRIAGKAPMRAFQKIVQLAIENLSTPSSSQATSIRVRTII